MEKLVFSDDQKVAFDKIMDWWNKGDQQVFTLVGYAGTGKSTIAAQLREAIDGSIAYVSLTGKAASVLRDKLSKQVNLRDNDYVGTIHGLIYYPEEDYDPTTKKVSIRFRLREEISTSLDLIIADEASMIGKTLYKDLIHFGVPILFTGDSAQLPPVKDSSEVHLDRPDTKLTKIHRQAEKNPIIAFSKMVREGCTLIEGTFANNVKLYNRGTKEGNSRFDEIKQNYNVDQDMIICGFNKTRVKLNQELRKAQGFTDPHPVPGDRVICLKNNSSSKIYNGMLGRITECSGPQFDSTIRLSYYTISVEFDDLAYEGTVLADQFNNPKSMYDDLTDLSARKGVSYDLFDYGYCISAHKAQGSEYPNVMVVREVCKYWEQKKWDYTAVTRAVDNLEVFL